MKNLWILKENWFIKENVVLIIVVIGFYLFFREGNMDSDIILYFILCMFYIFI